MSWSGGWFFLMAAEIFNVGSCDFRVPGLGSYLQTAASRKFARCCAWCGYPGRGDRFARPIRLAPYRLGRSIQSGHARRRRTAEVAVLDLISRAWLIEQFGTHIWRPFSEWVDTGFQRRTSGFIKSPEPVAEAGHSRLAMGILSVFLLLALYGGYRAASLLVTLPGSARAESEKGSSPLSSG